MTLSTAAERRIVVNRLPKLRYGDAAQIMQCFEVLKIEKGLHKNTVIYYSGDLKCFARWLNRPNHGLLNASRDDILGYFEWRNKLGHHANSNQSVLISFRAFYRYLFNHGLRLDDPTEKISGPHISEAIPRVITEQQVELLLNAPDITTPEGLRNKAMLELMYASGFKVSELVYLPRGTLDLNKKVVRITAGNGSPRLVPLGEEACYWLARYFKEARPILTAGFIPPGITERHRATIPEVYNDLEPIFIRASLEPLNRSEFWTIVSQYAQQVGIPKAAISTHAIRHSFATHLLNNGADLRALQIFLGFRKLSSTQIYSLVAKERLQSMHTKHHPRG